MLPTVLINLIKFLAPTDRMVVIDVYADWCVACQPIEHRILKDAEVQNALAPYYLIKLDLATMMHHIKLY